MAKIIVSKFGGSSVANHIDDIAFIVKQNPLRKVVVVSAPGARFSGDVKVTDMLIELANKYDVSLVDKIIERYKAHASDEQIAVLRNDLISRTKSTLEGLSRVDHIISFGEEASAKVVAKILNMPYIDPRILIVSSEFGNARFIGCTDKKKLKFGVVPGFFGYTEDGKIATVGRGGSDYTGSFVAAMVGAEVYENFTDIEGVMGINPSMIKDLILRDGEQKHVIRYITYRELSELAYQGFRVFQGKALEPAEENGVMIHIRKTDRSLPEGTYVIRYRTDVDKNPVVGVAYVDGVTNFRIRKFGIADEVGFGEKVLKAFTDARVSWETMHTSVETISVQVKNTELKNSFALHSVMEKLIANLDGDYAKLESDYLGFMVVVGQGIDYEMSLKIASVVESSGADVRFHYFGVGSPVVFVLGSKGEEATRLVYEKFVRKN